MTQSADTLISSLREDRGSVPEAIWLDMTVLHSSTKWVDDNRKTAESALSKP